MKYFASKYKNIKQAPVAIQLLLFLKKTDLYSTKDNNNKLADFFGIAKGSIDNYVEHVQKALIKLKHSVLVWPDDKKKKINEATNKDSVWIPKMYWYN